MSDAIEKNSVKSIFVKVIKEKHVFIIISVWQIVKLPAQTAYRSLSGKRVCLRKRKKLVGNEVSHINS